MLQIDDKLIEQWEPKVHQMLRDRYVALEYEDACQILRLAIVRAAKKFDETRGASFHTYLHMVMVNTLTSANEDVRTKNPPTEILEDTEIDKYDSFDTSTMRIMMSEKKLTIGETIVLDILLCGYKKRELYEICQNRESTSLALAGLKTKFSSLLELSVSKRRRAKKWLHTKA